MRNRSRLGKAHASRTEKGMPPDTLQPLEPPIIEKAESKFSIPQRLQAAEAICKTNGFRMLANGANPFPAPVSSPVAGAEGPESVLTRLIDKLGFGK